MKASEEDDFLCPLCGGNLLWMPVSRIFVCEHCRESFSESAKYYLRKKEDVTKGNAQAMREALGDVYNILEKIQSFTPRLNDVSLMREFRSRVCHAKRVIDAALSAPARNCDMFGTDNTEAELAYEEYCEKSEIEESITGAFEWLFAPAERKGE